MSEHTKTPWRVKPETALIEQLENGLWGLIVADCSMTDESSANAAFIVKTVNSHPELVKALENLLCFLDNATDYELQHAANYSAYLDAKAALKPIDVGGIGCE